MTPLEAGTKLLLHFDASSPSSFTDASPMRNKINVFGAVGANASAKFGSYCYDYSGSATLGVGLSVTQMNFNLGTLPYSMEAWVYPYSLPSSGVYWMVGIGYGSFPRPALQITTTGAVQLSQTDTGNSNSNLVSADTLTLNQWAHIAASRDSRGVTRLFINGKLSAATSTVTDMTTTYSPSSGLYDLGVGCNPGSGGQANIFKGRLDEVRFTFPVTPYDLRLTIPTAAFPDSGGGDSSFSSVSLLLHGEGSNGGTTITDSSNNTLTPSQIGTSGNVTTSTANFRFGSASLRFGGTNAISYASSALFEAASRDWTIECWINTDVGSDNNARHLWQLFGSSINFRANIYTVRSTNTIAFYTENGTSTGGTRISASNVLIPGQWQHVALVKEGNAFTLWVDGVPVGSAYVTLFPTGNLGLTIGTQNFSPAGTDPFIGYVEEMRVTMGVARYPMNFTAPTSAYSDPPAISGASNFSKIGIRSTMSLVAAPKALYGPIQIKDAYDGGKGYITGTLKEKRVPPPSIARHERVRLIRERDGRCIRETWADATTGNFAFYNIDETIRYTLVAYDHTNALRAVIADNIQPST